MRLDLLWACVWSRSGGRGQGWKCGGGNIFRQGIERKCHQLAEEEAQEGEERKITTYCVLLSQVTYFNFMGRVLATEEDDWPSVMHNLRRARQKWAWLTHILISEGADAQILGHIYLAVVQSVLLYGSET